jgi:hypothetical protein
MGMMPLIALEGGDGAGGGGGWRKGRTNLTLQYIKNLYLTGTSVLQIHSKFLKRQITYVFLLLSVDPWKLWSVERPTPLNTCLG